MHFFGAEGEFGGAEGVLGTVAVHFSHNYCGRPRISSGKKDSYFKHNKEPPADEKQLKKFRFVICASSMSVLGNASGQRGGETYPPFLWITVCIRFRKALQGESRRGLVAFCLYSPLFLLLP
ncbi:hypothetical protein ABK905_08320 [Acerihabitans sp. KWT182]|uniref:Uncharacterized protein n=1 Tax=Acerihabitans sp. KWT182 TaxID=3157919 RepID=A0AAU7QCY1_9GAMM